MQNLKNHVFAVCNAIGASVDRSLDTVKLSQPYPRPRPRSASYAGFLKSPKFNCTTMKEFHKDDLVILLG